MGIMPDYNFMATGIGSVPWTDSSHSCARIRDLLPEIPFWPQLVKRSPFENMLCQFTEGIPLIEINSAGIVLLSDTNREDALTGFYSHYIADDLEYFKISRDYAEGLFKMIELEIENPCSGKYIKGHITGPVTFAAGIKDREGKTALSNPDILEAFTKGLAIKALWQVKELEKTGKKPIIFLDEPYLACFGSAFSIIDREGVIKLLREVIDFLKERSAVIIGIHCCGNTDWSMIMDSGVDIINLDAFAYQDYLFLYPDHLKRFISNGGAIAWGIVPTGESAGTADIDELYTKLMNGLNNLMGLDLDKDLVYSASILTPACGMGMMAEKATGEVLDLLSKLSKRMRATI
jgi:methionine synthase II (cobalamin-independent)